MQLDIASIVGELVAECVTPAILSGHATERVAAIWRTRRETTEFELQLALAATTATTTSAAGGDRGSGSPGPPQRRLLGPGGEHGIVIPFGIHSHVRKGRWLPWLHEQAELQEDDDDECSSLSSDASSSEVLPVRNQT